MRGNWRRCDLTGGLLTGYGLLFSAGRLQRVPTGQHLAVAAVVAVTVVAVAEVPPRAGPQAGKWQAALCALLYM